MVTEENIEKEVAQDSEEENKDEAGAETEDSTYEKTSTDETSE